MKVLVVIFALLGMLATIGLGAVFDSVVKEDDQKGDSMKSQTRELERLGERIKADDDIKESEKKDVLAAIERVASAGKDLRQIPTPLFIAGGVGLLMMILSLANAGPKPVHAVGFFAAAVGPMIWTYFAILRPLQVGLELIAKHQGALDSADKKSVAEGASMFLYLMGGAGGAFVLAAIFALLVKRAPKNCAQPPMQQPPMQQPPTPPQYPQYPQQPA